MIVFCHLLNDNSGSPIVLRSVIQALAGVHGGRALFVGSQGRGCLESSGATISRYWYVRSRFRLVTLVTFLASQLSLYRTLSRSNLPDDAVIYVNTLFPFGAAIWCRHNDRTVIYHLHEVSVTPSLLRRFLVGVVEKTARHVFYVSHDHRKRLPIRGVPNTVLTNAIPRQIAEHGFATPYTPRRSGLFDVLMLASPKNYKGVPEFLDLARGFEDREDVHFTLVLNASEGEIEAYLPEDSRPANMTIHPRTDAPAYFYSTADVLLNLSRTDQWIETFGLTIVEAMAFGLPVIAPPVGGPTELITDEQEGFLVDSRDGRALIERLRMLADNPATTLKMSAAARLRARDFTEDCFAKSLQAAVRPLCASPSNQD